MKKNKNLFLIFNFYFFIFFTASAQPPGQWMWIHGTNVVDAPGNWGTIGISGPSNVPESVYEPCEWTDLNGNFWMFGGRAGTNGQLGALWKYDPAINQWTWMKGPSAVNDPGSYGVQGIPSPNNYPPSRTLGFVSWTDLEGNLWMFGGCPGYTDLWKYTISTNEWTWMKGPNTTMDPGTYGTQGISDIANNPAYRWETAGGWTDNYGNLWFFGGSCSTGYLNDLWRYNIATNCWTWMKGSNLAYQPSIYGTKGVEDTNNTPGGRVVYCRWKDNDGNFWMFSGNNDYSLDELWRFNPVTNNWTWMSGGNIGGHGHYGTKCVTTTNNIPSARYENRLAWNVNGNLFTFGGDENNLDLKNDLWTYCISSNQWTWLSGDSTVNPVGNWGIKNVPNVNNKPKGKRGAIGWQDNNGHLYVFGGYSYGHYNDLWRYTIDPNCSSPCVIPPSIAVSNDTVLCIGNCTTVRANVLGSAPPFTYSWTPNIGNGAGPFSVCPSSTTTYAIQVTDTLGNLVTDSIVVTVSNNSIPVLTTSVPSSICEGDSIVLSISGASTYSWMPCLNLNSCIGSSVIASPSASMTYTIVGTDSNGCSALDSISLSVNPSPVIIASSPIPICSGDSTLISVTGASTYSWAPCSHLNICSGDTVIAAPSVTTTYSITGTDSIGCASTVPIIVNVNPLPLIVPITSLVSYIGDSTALTLTGASQYHWSPITGLSNPNGTDSASLILYLDSTTTYTVTGHTDQGCVATTSFTVAVFPPINVTVSHDTIMCKGDCANVFVSASGGAAPLTYSWTPNIGSGPGPFSVCPSSTTIYTAHLTDSAGTVTNALTTVAVNSFPSLITSAPVTIYMGDSTVLSVSGAAFYSWSPCSYLSACNGDHVIAFPPFTKTYAVSGIDSIGCASIDSITVTVDSVPQFISQLNQHEFYVTAYPNPFIDGFSFHIFSSGIKAIDVIIYDAIGREVESCNDVTENIVVGNNLSKGIYFVEARQGNKMYRLHIVKQ